MDWLPYILFGTGVVVSFVVVMRWMQRDLRADVGTDMGPGDRPEIQVDRAEARVGRLETRLDGRVDRLETRVGRLETRIDGRVARLETRLDGLAADLRALSGRLARLEGAVGSPWHGPRTRPVRPLRSPPARRTPPA